MDVQILALAMPWKPAWMGLSISDGHSWETQAASFCGFELHRSEGKRENGESGD